MEENNKFFVGVRFPTSDKTYYYSTKITELVPGDLVIVDSEDNIEAATVVTTVMNQETNKVSMDLKPIIRKATGTDVKIFKANLASAQECMVLAQREVDSRNMPMDFVAAAFSFSGDIITLTYTSTEKWVDFRELLPVLGSKLKARVSLRQIASRDRAKMIGGIGICGLPLCCSTFLTNFESIAISKMKNQMLAINIPKYSGPCDKLMCCLAFEDETYTIEKKDFPRIGQEVKVDGEPYTVNSFNIISRTVRLSNADHSDFQTVSLEDCLAMIKGTYKPRPVEAKAVEEYKLPDFGLTSKNDNFEKKNGDLQGNRGKDNRNNGSNKRQDNQNRNNDRNNRNGEQRNGGNDNQRRDNNGGNNRNRNRHNHDKNRGGNQNQNRGNENGSRQQNDRPNKNQPNQNNQNPQGQQNGGNNNRNRNRHRHHGHRPSGNNKPGDSE